MNPLKCLLVLGGLDGSANRLRFDMPGGDLVIRAIFQDRLDPSIDTDFHNYPDLMVENFHQQVISKA